MEVYKKDEISKKSISLPDTVCEFPWTSLSVMSNGIVVPCTQDYLYLYKDFILFI